jgi:hypothetical protein
MLDPTPVVAPHSSKPSPPAVRQSASISVPAGFVTGVKSTAVSDAELETIARRAGLVAASVDIHRPSTALTDYQELGYYNHLDHPSRWRF